MLASFWTALTRSCEKPDPENRTYILEEPSTFLARATSSSRSGFPTGFPDSLHLATMVRGFPSMLTDATKSMTSSTVSSFLLSFPMNLYSYFWAT